MSDRVYEVLAHALLEAHPYAGGQPEHVVRILQTCAPRELADGEILCREGEPGWELYILLRGRVRVEKAGPEGEPVYLGSVRAPALLGQMAILDRSRRSATCVAEGTTLVVVMEQPRFDALVRSTEPEGHTLRRLLLSSLTRQLVKGNAHMRKVMASMEAGGADPKPGLRKARAVLEGWTAPLDASTAPLDAVAKD